MSFWEDLFKGFGRKPNEFNVIKNNKTSGSLNRPKNYSTNTDRKKKFNSSGGSFGSFKKNTDRFPVNRVQRKPSAPFVPSPNRVDRITQPNTYMGNPGAGVPSSVFEDTTPIMDPMESRINDILDSLDDTYEMPPAYQGDYGRANMMKALNDALGGALGGINSARSQTQGNFRESDRNLADMHAALQGNIRTEGAQSFNNIADTLIRNQSQTQDSAVNRLQQMEAQERAERMAMLKNLGIQASAASPESTVYDDASANIISRGNISQNLAQQDRATNLRYNEGMAQTAGMQGASRRAALNQQLQSILGQLSGKESDVKTDYSRQVAAAENEIDTRRMQYEAQRNGMSYEQWKNQQDNLRNTLGMLYENQNASANRDEERRRWEAEQEMQRQQMEIDSQPEPYEPPKPPKLTGLPGQIDNLVNAGFPPEEIQRGMAALEEGMAEGAFDRNSSTKDQVNYLISRRIPRAVAVQLVVAYGNV